MNTTLRGLFIFAVLFGLIGLCLGYDGIARMQRRAVPPFNDGLYSAVWSVPPPPRQLVLFWNALLGRILAWSSLIAIPSIVAGLLVRHESILPGFLILGIWTVSTGLVGVWIWGFSLFS